MKVPSGHLLQMQPSMTGWPGWEKERSQACATCHPLSKDTTQEGSVSPHLVLEIFETEVNLCVSRNGEVGLSLTPLTPTTWLAGGGGTVAGSLRVEARWRGEPLL